MNTMNTVGGLEPVADVWEPTVRACGFRVNALGSEFRRPPVCPASPRPPEVSRRRAQARRPRGPSGLSETR
jgi:hypothetical protein